MAITDIDVNFFKPFVDGTIHMLDVQCGCETKYQPPYLKGKKKSDLNVSIAGMVGIWTDKYRGVICLCFPETTFLSIMSKMLDEDFKKIDEENRDGAGEMMNIVYGFAKRILNEQGHTFEKALPGIITGQNLEVSHEAGAPVFVLPFTSELGSFELEIGLIHKET